MKKWSLPVAGSIVPANVDVSLIGRERRFGRAVGSYPDAKYGVLKPALAVASSVAIASVQPVAETAFVTDAHKKTWNSRLAALPRWARRVSLTLPQYNSVVPFFMRSMSDRTGERGNIRRVSTRNQV